MRAEPVTPEMLRDSLAKATAPKPEPAEEFAAAMATALEPLNALTDALTARLEAVEARTVKQLGLGR